MQRDFLAIIGNHNLYSLQISRRPDIFGPVLKTINSGKFLDFELPDETT